MLDKHFPDKQDAILLEVFILNLINMKKCCTLATAFLLVGVFINAQSQQFRLEGEIKDADSLTEATIMIWGNSKFANEPVKIINRKFVFEGTIEHPCLAIINTDKVRGGLGVWLTSDTIKALFYVNKYRLLHALSVEGSEESKDYLTWINSLNEWRQKEPDKIKRYMYIWKGIDDYVTAHPESFLSEFMIRLEIGEDGSVLARSIYDKLSPKIKATETGQGLLKKIENAETNALGKKISAFSLPDINGKLVSIDSTAKTWTILHFWDSWCAPCRVENRDLIGHQKLLKEKGVKLIGISLDETRDTWLKSIEKDKITWLELNKLKPWNENEIIKQFKIYSIPYSILIDENMVIQSIGMNNIIAKIQDL